MTCRQEVASRVCETFQKWRLYLKIRICSSQYFPLQVSLSENAGKYFFRCQSYFPCQYPFSYGALQDQHADPETISELLGPVVQNIVSLTSLLMVKMLTVLLFVCVVVLWPSQPTGYLVSLPNHTYWTGLVL